MPKAEKNIRRFVKDRLKVENRRGSVRRRGRSSMDIADEMSTGRRRKNQSTDSNN